MDKKRLKIAYVPPQAEVCAAEPYRFLAASTHFDGGHHDGSDDGGATGGDAGIGDDDGEIVGAKGFGLNEDWGDLWKE